MLHASNITCAEFQCICYWTVGTAVWFMLRVTCGRLVFWNQMSKWTKLFFGMRVVTQDSYSTLDWGLYLLTGIGRQEGHPACKKRVVGCWHGDLSRVRCRLAYGPADATATHCVSLQ